jgi:uncharacterized C2H2 Zn-finger protein
MGSSREKLMCPICSKQYVSKGSLLRHCKIEHQQDISKSTFPDEGISPLRLRSGDYECYGCGGKFKSLQEMEKHMSTNHPILYERFSPDKRKRKQSSYAAYAS